MEKKLGSIRGRRAIIDALIGNEHYLMTRHLGMHSDWLRKLSQHTLIGCENYQKIRSTQMGIEKGYRQTDLLTHTIALVAMPLRGRSPQKWHSSISVYFKTGHSANSKE